jgi:hypothetical protein
MNVDGPKAAIQSPRFLYSIGHNGSSSGAKGYWVQNMASFITVLWSVIVLQLFLILHMVTMLAYVIFDT